MKCPKCNSTNHVKNGKVGQKQRHKCKSCGCNFTKSTRQGYPKSKKKLALQMYIEGIGFRQIGRILKVSYGTIFGWIKFAAKEIQTIEKDNKPKKVRIMELDEMWSFVQKKEKQSGSGWLLIEKKDELSTSILVIEE